MTVRELINKLMDMNLDKPVYITEISDDFDKCIGYVEGNPIKFADYEIIDVDIHGIYDASFNCITIKN